MTHRRRILAFIAGGFLGLCSCAREERVVNYKPFFTGLADAKFQTPPVADSRVSRGGGDAAAAELPEGFDPVRMEVKNPDGSVTLISRSGLHLMRHIERCLAEDNAKLFAEQVLSERTRQEFIERGKSPREALAMLKRHERDISRLFARLPMGEHSPNVILRTVDRNVWRVELRGQDRHDLRSRGARFVGFDMVLEAGHWRLRWFI